MQTAAHSAARFKILMLVIVLHSNGCHQMSIRWRWVFSTDGNLCLPAKKPKLKLSDKRKNRLSLIRDMRQSKIQCVEPSE